jgi:AraC-like DNA-binding protein
MRNRSHPDSDPLAQMLEMLEPECRVTGRLVAGGDWVRGFSTLDATKFCVATLGSCWYMVDAHGPAQLSLGDVLITNGTTVLTVAGTFDALHRATHTPLVTEDNGRYRLGEGEDFAMLVGLVTVHPERQRLLRSTLPPAIHVHADTAEAAPLAWLLSQVLLEMQPGKRPGSASVLAGVTNLLFVHALRAYMAHAPVGDQNWLKGLGDPRLGTALGRIHNCPSHNWSVGELAREAHMSRTSFAVRFRTVMGIAPLAYLTQWRMHLAQRALQMGASVAEAAVLVGYASESAFRVAYKRAMDAPPGSARRTIDGYIVAAGGATGGTT